jgi:hypothetical protein
MLPIRTVHELSEIPLEYPERKNDPESPITKHAIVVPFYPVNSSR